MSAGWLEELAQEVIRLRRQVETLQHRVAMQRNPRQTRLAVTVPDPYTGLYPCSPSNVFWIVFVDGSFPEDVQGIKDWTIKPRQEETEPLTTAMSIGVDCWVPRYSLLLVHFLNKQWWFQKPSQGLVRLRLEEDHPGYRGAEFDISIGTEDEETQEWLFSQDTYSGIDWHHDSPYPEKGAQGYGQWELNEELDEIPENPPEKILHVVSLDCVAPDYDEDLCED